MAGLCGDQSGTAHMSLRMRLCHYRVTLSLTRTVLRFAQQLFLDVSQTMPLRSYSSMYNHHSMPMMSIKSAFLLVMRMSAQHLGKQKQH